MSNWKQDLKIAADHFLSLGKRDAADPAIKGTIKYQLEALGVIKINKDGLIEEGDKSLRDQWINSYANQALDANTINALREEKLLFTDQKTPTAAQIINAMLAAVDIKKAVNANGDLVDVTAHMNNAHEQQDANKTGNVHDRYKAPGGQTWVQHVGDPAAQLHRQREAMKKAMQGVSHAAAPVKEDPSVADHISKLAGLNRMSAEMERAAGHRSRVESQLAGQHQQEMNLRDSKSDIESQIAQTNAGHKPATEAMTGTGQGRSTYWLNFLTQQAAAISNTHRTAPAFG